MSEVTISLTLPAGAAAGLKRFAEKVSHSDAMVVLYPHVSKETRTDQAYEIMDAFAAIDKALADAHVSIWPWIESGRATGAS